ncbi:MAG: carbonic anhydrase [Deltaproteobacteria bacterium]|nr:carbonic anhydrase [Deltaproteobacteria bacterium]
MTRYPCALAATAVLVLLAGPLAAASPDGMQRLTEGNQRWASGRAAHPQQSAARRAELAQVQHPFAVIVSCADSRVPPELIFDQGVGDLFVVRAAGEVVDAVTLGSIEFAVANLGARLIVVLGHERCGAVDAALRGVEPPGHIGAVLSAIEPNISRAQGATPETLDRAVRDQARAVVRQLRGAEPILAPRVRDGSLRVVGAVYDLDSGQVSLLEEPEARP